MRLFNFEWRTQWKSLLIWNVSVVGFLALAMSMFPSFAEMGPDLDLMMDGFPPEMRKALGFYMIDFGDPIQYLSYMFQYVLVALAAFAILLGGSSVSKEESEHTIDFLYGRPVTRLYIYSSKIAHSMISVIITAAAFFVGCLGVLAAVSESWPVQEMIILSVGLLLFMLFFLSIGIVLGHFIIKPARRLPIGLGIVFVMFFTAILSNINDKMDPLKYITPYRWFEAMHLVRNGVNVWALIATLAVIFIGLAGTGKLYLRKDFT